MSREYAKRSRGGSNLPLIIAIIGTVIVIAVILYFLLGTGGGGGLFAKATATPEPTPVMTETPTPSPSPSPTPQPTVVVVIPEETPTPALMTATPTPTPQKTYQSATVWANSLNVREGPGLDYAKIATVKYGQTFKVWDETSRFVKIQLPSGTFGWIWEDYTVRGDATLPAAPTSEPDPSMMSKAELVDSTTIKVTFTTNVWGNSANTAAVSATAFEVKEGSSTVSITGISDCQGGTFVNLTIGTTSGGDLTVKLKEDGVYDTDGEGTTEGTYNLGAGADNVAPTASFSVSGNDITVTFSEGVYNTSSGSGALEASDFQITSWLKSDSSPISPTITSFSHTAGSKTVTFTISYSESAGTETGNTIILKSSSAYDAAGNVCAQTTKGFDYTVE